MISQHCLSPLGLYTSCACDSRASFEPAYLAIRKRSTRSGAPITRSESRAFRRESRAFRCVFTPWKMAGKAEAVRRARLAVDDCRRSFELPSDPQWRPATPSDVQQCLETPTNAQWSPATPSDDQRRTATPVDARWRLATCHDARRQPVRRGAGFNAVSSHLRSSGFYYDINFNIMQYLQPKLRVFEFSCLFKRV